MKGLNDSHVQRALKVCRSMVAAFSRSWKKKRDLAIAQGQKNLPIYQLKLNAVTRWGSAYDMVERVLEQIEASRIVRGADRSSSHLIPTWQDSDVLQAVATAVKPLKEMTDALSTEKEDDVELTKEIKERIRVDMEMRYVEPALDADRVKEDVEKQMLECFSSERITTESTDEDTTTDRPPAKKAKGLSKILGRCLGHSSAAPSTPQEKVKQQLDQYLSHPHLDVEECPPKWWRNESSRYPLVAQLARRLNLIDQAMGMYDEFCIVEVLRPNTKW
ncbi:zinc finger BED domain-containing protein 4-like [Dysidea avara]|uniref:zinc finger BED domain-containing protein 4-like n=1 Tax=Dysidea avara TaxID=196820 RepID=UPI00332CA9CD